MGIEYVGLFEALDDYVYVVFPDNEKPPLEGFLEILVSDEEMLYCINTNTDRYRRSESSDLVKLDRDATIYGDKSKKEILGAVSVH